MLTKEERELIESMRSFTCKAVSCTTHSYACDCINKRITDLIDRLTAENKALVEAGVNLSSECVKSVEYQDWPELQDRVNALSEAVRKARGEK